MGALLRMVLLLATSAVIVAAQTAPRVWNVRLADGANTSLSVSYSSGLVEFRQAGVVSFKIPAASIQGIFHMTERFWRPTRVSNRFCDKLGCKQDRGGDALGLLVTAITTPLGRGKTHYVEVNWIENAERGVVLEIGKDHYLPFLAWLQQVSGTNWRDIDQERAAALKQIDQRAGEAFPVALQYPAEGGGYQALDCLVLPVESLDHWTLYFFRGQVKPKNLFWVAPVTREPSVNDCVRNVEVEYGKCDQHVCQVGAVLLQTVTYRLLGTPDTQAENSAQSDCARLKAQRDSRRSSYPPSSNEQPTLKRPDSR